MCDLDDLRVCFVGDSFVAGVGDPEHLGWVGRLADQSGRAGRRLTAYNLGVRRQTSRDVGRRWLLECEQRLPAASDCRVVLSFGVNDTTDDGAGAGPRVQPHDSAAQLAEMLQTAAERGWAALVVGPPPVADVEHNQRIEQLNRLFRDQCHEAAAPYVSVFEPLRSDEVWMTEVHRGDGAHPAADGYRRFTELVWPAWNSWTTPEPEGVSAANRHVSRPTGSAPQLAEDLNCGSGERDLGTLLHGMRPRLREGQWVFVTAPSVPAQVQPLALFAEDEGISLLLSREEADAAGLPYDYVAAWISLTVHSALDAIGLTAAVAGALASVGISCNVVAANFHDHLFVASDQALLAVALLERLSSSHRD